jgi:two-component system, OmpR family, response regulator
VKAGMLEKVLIVDDEDDIRAIAEIGLRSVGGLETVVASSGAEGIRRARDDQPDLILLDMMMPEMDGMQTLERLRADGTTASIPVIFMTARVQKHEIDAYLDLGAIGVLAKPFNPMELATEIRQLFEAAIRT